MQTNQAAAKIERLADTRRFTKRIGSTIYKVEVKFKADAKETIEEKIYRLIESEVKKQGA